MKKLWVILLLCCTAAHAQKPFRNFFVAAPTYNHDRGTIVFATEGVLLSSTLVGLDYLWYRHYTRSRFHFYNDNHEWLQMDKVGHATTAYNIGVLGVGMMRWTGMRQNQANWYGGVTGLLFLSVIEVLDGFSSKWGFSPGDMSANIAGAGLCIGQQFLWNQQRIQLKYTYQPSMYAQYRPEELGSNWIQRMLKDYNGQTYWLSANIYSFGKPSSNFPKWFNASVGYGAGGMLGGDYNPTEVKGVKLPSFERYRRLMLSADADLTLINTSSNAGNAVLSTFNFLKVPAPAIEYRFKQKGQLKLHIY